MKEDKKDSVRELVEHINDLVSDGDVDITHYNNTVFASSCLCGQYADEIVEVITLRYRQ